MGLKFSVVVIGLACSSFVHAQSADSRIESCNKIKNSKQRLNCLKAEMSTKSAPQKAVENKALKRLHLEEAVAICDSLVDIYGNPPLMSDHESPREETTTSTERLMAVTWLATSGKPPAVCLVDRVSRKVMSFEFRGNALSKENLENRATLVKLYEDIKAGKSSDFVRLSQVSLVKSFKDPASATYRGMYISKSRTGKMLYLCGEVNAKNSYGAYVGFKMFYSAPMSSLNKIEEERDRNFPTLPTVFETTWPRVCGDKILDVDN